MTKKGIVKILLAVMASVLIFSGRTYALSDTSDNEDYDFGRKEIEEALPEAAREELEEIDVTAENGGAGLSVGDVLGRLWETVCENTAKPVTMLVSIIGVVMLCTVIQSMHGGDNQLTGTFNTVGVLACSGIVCTSFASVISSSKTAIDGLVAFLSVYIPAFAGIMAANGQTAAAAAYSGVITVAVQVFIQLFTLVIFPLASCIMGISVAGAVNPDLRINNIAEMAKKIVNWCLVFIMTVFGGILSVQSLVGAAADSVSMRAVKFTVSGTVPIVGGAVSDALLAVKGSIGVIKAATGSYGIIASAAVMLPAAVTLFIFRITFMIAASVSDTFGTSRITVLLKSGESVISVIIAMLVCFWAAAVVSTAFMLVIGGGGI